MPALATKRRALPTEVTVETRGAVSALFSRRDREVLVSGPAGTGKTVGCLWKLHLAALKYPGMRGLIVRKTGTALAASAMVSFQKHVLGAGNFGVTFFGGSRLKPAQFEFPNGSAIVVGGMDNADKIMSTEYDLVYVNEATELDADDWESITTRLRHGVMPYQQIYGDCNPGPPSHWLKRRCETGKTLELPSKHEDNPRFHDGTIWTPEGLEYLSTLDALTGHRYQRLRLGKWVAAEGLVYPSFHPDQIRAVDCDGWGTVMGLDLGTRNPTSMHVYRYAGDRIHVESEFYRTGLGSDEVEAEAEARYRAAKAEWIVVDPSAAGLIVTLGGKSLSVRKANNDVIVGISRVTSVLPSITVDPSCVNMIAEFESYAYPTGGHTQKDAPVKANDHSMDELRYVTMELTGGRIPPSAAPRGVAHQSDWR